MENQQNNNQQNNEPIKKSKGKKLKISLLVSIPVITILFFLMKIINVLLNGENGLNLGFLTAFNPIGLIPPDEMNLPNIIDYIANITLLIVLPILVLLLLILIIKYKTKSTKKGKKPLDQLEENDIYTFENEKAEIDSYPHHEEDKTFFEEINIDDDLTLLQQRGKNDGSDMIKENLSELVKNADKIRNYAILNDIYVEDVVLEQMTKKELIVFMKKIGDELKEIEHLNLNKLEEVKEEKLNLEKENQNIEIIKAGNSIEKKQLVRKNKITKNELIDSIFSNPNNKMTKVKIKKIIDTMFELMKDNLIDENAEVWINNFAKFSTIVVKESIKNDLKTGELKTISAHKTIKFKPLKGLKDSINEAR
ncbi:HU family DNA-binding protein [Mesoplasma chauliocola]|uniref:HU family DNA-binding protein n=1 Tax=Mesoplasma chauliocola TaxID=216427 RepID=A0A249SN14_9MOLU|nr:HU family DNA-binding protein [Mesoplasma chauliocola]ASZ09065.1 HU family DNA-binding protein [Mesoplasma chauliocola]